MLTNKFMISFNEQIVQNFMVKKIDKSVLPSLFCILYGQAKVICTYIHIHTYSHMYDSCLGKTDR